ncbi:MAG: HAD-IA family hydrolase [Burkholderiaceae bacterium]
MTALTAEALHKLLPGKRLLVFDFDGTLADTSHLHAVAFNEVLEPWGLCVDYPAIAGLRTLDALAVCFATVGVNVPQSQLQQLTHTKQTRVRMLIQKELRPLSGVDEFLRWARPRYRLSLYSSGSRGTVTLAMEKLGYTGWFDPMLCAENVIHAKPHPEGFLKVLAMACIDAEYALVFEDSDAGIEAAERAGLATLDVRATPFEKFQAI